MQQISLFTVHLCVKINNHFSIVLSINHSFLVPFLNTIKLYGTIFHIGWPTFNDIFDNSPILLEFFWVFFINNETKLLLFAACGLCECLIIPQRPWPDFVHSLSGCSVISTSHGSLGLTQVSVHLTMKRFIIRDMHFYFAMAIDFRADYLN